MSDREALLDALVPLAATIGDLDLADPHAARATLDRAHPPSDLGALHAHLRAARDAGWLCPRQATPTLSFGRIAKPSEQTFGLSVDAVDMAGDGAAHTHPEGEVSLCFVEEGEPRFCGEAPGWVVVPPGSHHVPSVQGGRMLIVYFLPGGQIRFEG